MPNLLKELEYTDIRPRLMTDNRAVTFINSYKRQEMGEEP